MVHPHSNLVTIVDNLSITGNSLAAITGVVGAGNRNDTSREQGFRTLFQERIIELNDSDGSGGPILVGFCESTLTLAQIEEKLEADPQHMQDISNMEAQSRRLNLLGFVQNVGDKAVLIFKKRMKWSYIEGVGIQYFIYNTSTVAALDASNSIDIYCAHTGVFLRD